MTENGRYENGISSEPSELSVYKKDAISTVFFKIVYDINDVKSSSKKSIVFKPDMAHQVFGESESIFGYRSLLINLYYLHNSSRCFVDIQSSGKVEENELYKADDILKVMNQWLPGNYVVKESDFLEFIDEESHDQMYGSVIEEYNYQPENSDLNITYKITACDINNPDFKDFHSRFETFIVWFIDAANFIDLDDERWLIYYVYEEFTDPTTKKKYRSPVGFSTVYKFFAYPSNIRARISQFFVLPPHQKRGIGSKMYQAIFKEISSIPEVIDITVEEPTSTFQKIRDIHDSSLIFKQLKSENIEVKCTNQKKMFETMKKAKICKRQSQRIFDIMNCYKAKKMDVCQYQEYLNTIKTRIASEFEKSNWASKRLCDANRESVVTDSVDKNTLINAEFNRYVDDISLSVQQLMLVHKEL